MFVEQPLALPVSDEKFVLLLQDLKPFRDSHFWLQSKKALSKESNLTLFILELIVRGGEEERKWFNLLC